MDNHPPQFGPPEKLGRMVVEIPALCRSVSYENHMAFIFPPGLCCSLALVDPAGWTSWFIRRLYIIIQQSDWLYWESFAIICIYGIYSCSSNIFTWLATVNPSCHIGHRHVMVVMVKNAPRSGEKWTMFLFLYEEALGILIFPGVSLSFWYIFWHMFGCDMIH